jgi:hypothetical protein
VSVTGPGGTAQVSSVAHKLRLDQCTWCVQNARCHHKDGKCLLYQNDYTKFRGSMYLHYFDTSIVWMRGMLHVILLLIISEFPASAAQLATVKFNV